MTRKKTRLGLLFFGNSILIIVVGILLVASQLSAQNNAFNTLLPTTTPKYPTGPSYSYTSYDPILITDDTELASEANGGGTGASADPYIIEGYQIINNTANGIYITGTTKHFIVRDCWVETSSSYYGITAYNVAAGTATIDNNTVKNNLDGIYIRNSNFAAVGNNTCEQNSQRGIRIYGTTSATVVNNTCENNNDGIGLESATSVIVENNTCQSNNYGIRVRSNSDSTEVRNNTVKSSNTYGINVRDGTTESTIVANNTLQDNPYGIYISLALTSTVENNTFTNDGLFISLGTINAYLATTVEDNIVNGLSLGYLTNLEGTTVQTSYGQLILINCTNVLVKDIDQSSSDIGIYVRYSSDVELRHITMDQNSLYGVYIYDSEFVTLINSTISQSGDYGVYLRISNNVTLTNNTIYQNNDDGIYMYDSDNCTINWNTVEDNDYGIYMTSDSDNNTIHHNSFISNAQSHQAYESTNSGGNNWYDSSTDEGNYWSDGSPPTAYTITGGTSTDPYPLTEQTVYTVPEFNLPMGAVIILAVIITGLISHQKQKRRK
ncbi:MAG: NosD domain-containing protein [Candidatus Hodarchaeales archaeon]|jgi:parallel beta-helix repeat protein